MAPKKILVVDDEESIRILVGATLHEDSHYSIVTARNGDEALQLALDEKPDLVILDVMMPGRDGYDVCRLLKSNETTRGTRVILLTAMAQATDRQKGQEAGADDYLTKPFSPSQLLETVTTTLGQRDHP